jgi:hypothetical protein
VFGARNGTTVRNTTVLILSKRKKEIEQQQRSEHRGEKENN